MNWEDHLQDCKGVNAECDADGIPEYADRQDANAPSLLTALKMHNEELALLSAEVGRSLTVMEAHQVRLRLLKQQMVAQMLEECERGKR